jgi:hypothetical protein
MSTPSSSRASNGNGQVPSWMQTVDEDTFYDADPADDTSTDRSVSSPTEASTQSAPSDPSSDPQRISEDSSLEKDLALSMAEPPDIPEPKPDLQPTPVGRVRADLDQQLEKAVSVLATRYASGLPKSLILEYALQRTLLSLRQDGADSALVRWLDSVLPRA